MNGQTGPYSASLQSPGLDLLLPPPSYHVTPQGFMRVKLRTGSAFHGVIHARDSRDNACLTYGTGRTTTFLTVNLLTPVKHAAFCGVSYNNVSGALTI